MQVTLLLNTLLRNERHRAGEKVDVDDGAVADLIAGGIIKAEDMEDIGPSAPVEPEPEPEPSAPAKAKRTSRKKVTA